MVSVVRKVVVGFGIEILLERLSASNNMTFNADIENPRNFTQVGFFCRIKFAPTDHYI